MTTLAGGIRPRRVAAYAATRLVELGLIALGVGFTFFSTAASSDVQFLLGWDFLALIYLTVGILRIRRRRRRADPIQPGTGPLTMRLLTGTRLNFAFTLAASLVGMSSVSSVLSYGKDATFGHAIRALGTVAIVAAWMLLHSGYARFYAGLYYESAGGGHGLEFPRSERPAVTDFLYFSFTLGTSFAVSDVNVTSSAMRWHVMVHTVLSFFYNAIVLALAIGILTGR